MDLTNIRTFLQIVASGSFAGAAQELQYAQSTVSAQIQALERELGFPLFERIGRKNYLTNVFSASEGVPLMEYINRSKLSYMLVLIRRYSYTLAQAGKQVGLTDVNYISRIFKRYYGMTITDYKHTLERKDHHV